MSGQVGHRPLALELHIYVQRSVRVRLHRQARASDAKRCEQLGLVLVGAPLRHALLHPSERTSLALPLQVDWNDAETCLEPHRGAVPGRPGRHRRAEHGVPRERQLVLRSEDAHTRIAVPLRRQQEHGLGEVELSGEPLHQPGAEADGVGEDS